MKGGKGSSISYSYLYIIAESANPDEKKKIVFPSNYSSLMKSVNYLYKDKLTVRSIYTSDGELVRSTNDIRPGMLIYVSSREPREQSDNENDSKAISLYSPNKESGSLNNVNKMSKDRKNAYNALFGPTTQNNNQSRLKSRKITKNNSNNPTAKRSNKSNAKIHQNTNNESKVVKNNDSVNEKSTNKTNIQREKSVESLNSTSENINKPRKAYQASSVDNNSFYNENNDFQNYPNKNDNNNLNQAQSNQQVIHKVPSNLYNNLKDANQDKNQYFDNESNADKKYPESSTEINDQENYFVDVDNASVEEYSSNLYNNKKYYYESTSEVRDIDSCYRNDDNDEDETNLCRIATELLNEESFANNIKSSLKLLDDDVQSKFLRTEETLETNQRNYWYLRYLQYLKEQNTAQHGNYMFAYDAMLQYVKDFVAKHRFISYPISNLNRKQKHPKKDNNNANADYSSVATTATNVTTNTTTSNSNSSYYNQIHYWIKSKCAICGPRKSGKSTLLSLMAEQIITETAICGLWKKTIFYMLNMEECGPLFDDFKSLYIYFIEFVLKAIVLQKPELTPHYSMLVKFFASIFEYNNAPKLKKIFSTNPQFQKFSLNCENLVAFFLQMWNNEESHFLFFMSIFQIPSLFAAAAEIDNVFLFVDNVECINMTVHDDLESGQEFNVFEAFSLLLERVNYILTCEDQTDMFDTLDNKTEIICTFQMNAQSQYDKNQLIVEYEFDETENLNRRKRYKNEVQISQSQKMILGVSYCGNIPAYVSLWDEINAIADEIDQASEKEKQNNLNEEEEEKSNENNEIDELYEVLISLVQRFVNDMVVDNEREAKIRVISVRRSSK